MKSLKNVLIFLKNVSKKILASVTGVIGVLLLTSCCSPKEIVQPTIKIVPTHKIDTCFVVKSDTILCFETDTLIVETIVRDTIFKLRVETKPIIVRDTIITKVEKEKAKKNEEKAKEIPRKTKIFLAFLMCFILPPLLFFIKKK